MSSEDQDYSDSTASIRRELETIDMKYSELSKDLSFVEICEEYNEYLKKMLDIYDMCEQMYMNYDEASYTERAELDLFIAFAYNTLQYIYVKTMGQDDTFIKKELERIREAMKRLDNVVQISNRPETTPAVAKRMVLRSLAINELNEKVLLKSETVEDSG